ncbi:hypothetical protein Hanom_Chr14g01328321 [Helianthus anomalus]
MFLSLKLDQKPSEVIRRHLGVSVGAESEGVGDVRRWLTFGDLELPVEDDHLVVMIIIFHCCSCSCSSLTVFSFRFT